jgi:hypothetical protein
MHRDEGRWKRRVERKGRTAGDLVGAGTCGPGAGAAATHGRNKGVRPGQVTRRPVVEVGCIGLCAVEPIVDILLPGMNRVSFWVVTHDRVGMLLESMLVRAGYRLEAALCHSGVRRAMAGLTTFENTRSSLRRPGGCSPTAACWIR